MTKTESGLNSPNERLLEPEFEGVYGRYKVTLADQKEVQFYRISVLICGVAFCGGISQWLILGPTYAWIWLVLMAISLGLALQWIHIYLRPLHNALKVLWALGCLGFLFIGLHEGTAMMLSIISKKPIWTLIVGPFFAALTGLGFKEFFCFQRIEAIGLTLLVPIALIGHLSGVLNQSIVIISLGFASVLLIMLAIRKFGMDLAADIGDKSVFEYLKNQKAASTAS